MSVSRFCGFEPGLSVGQFEWMARPRPNIFPKAESLPLGYAETLGSSHSREASGAEASVERGLSSKSEPSASPPSHF